MSVEVISVHIPKAAGSSLRESFAAVYGKGAVYLDYADDPVDPCSDYNVDPDSCRRKAPATCSSLGARVVHGHFHPSKYEFIENAKRITFLRHPIDNLISIYHFWKTSETGHCLFNYFRNNNLTLLELAHLPAIRYLLSRTYFGSVDMKSFDFIGLMETYSEDLQMLSRLLSIPMVESKENVNKYPGYLDEISAIKADKPLRTALHNCLSEDIEFYERIRMSREMNQQPEMRLKSSAFK